MRWFSRRDSGQLVLMGLIGWVVLSAFFIVLVLSVTGSGLLGPVAAQASFVLRRRVAKGGIQALFFHDEFKSSREALRLKRVRTREQMIKAMIAQETESNSSLDHYYPGQYAGVMVDTARQPWSLAELREVVDFLSKIDGLNLLHLRLSDDQGFVLALDRHPELLSVAFNVTRTSGTFTKN